jgi:hypothetical protein
MYRLIIKRMKNKINGEAVLGPWGITLVSVDSQFQDKVFNKEIKRLGKLGFGASIVSVEIKIIFPKKQKS